MLFEPASQGHPSILSSTAQSLSSTAQSPSPPSAPPRRSRPASSLEAQGRWSPWDYAGVLLGFLLTLTVTLVNARGRIFWEDEMLGWMLLHDPSWQHMVHAWNVGADGGGLSFYLLGRGWFRLFGSSVLAFRLFSSTCFGLAFAVVWATLRRFYPVWIVAFATFNTLFFSPPLTTHLLEGRFYGLLVLATALAAWLAVRLDAEPDPTPPRFYAYAFLIHGLLTTSHVLGVVYSFFLLAALVILDRLRSRRRLGLYLSAAAGWLLLLPERTSLHAAGLVGKPHFWTKTPTPGQIVGGFTGSSPEILLVVALLGLGAGLVLWRSPAGFRATLRRNFQARSAVYVAAGCLLLVPVWFLLEGLVATWLFADRYLQPVAVGLALLTAELLTLASGSLLVKTWRQQSPRLARLASSAAAGAFALLLVFWVFHHVARYTPEAIDFTGPLTAHLPRNLPVVVEDAFTFTGLMSKEADSPVRYTFLLDWPHALSPTAPWLEVTQFHLMENWKAAGYFADRIESLEPFLQQHPQFLVVSNSLLSDPSRQPEIGNPLAARLAATPGYEVRKLFTLDRAFKDDQRDTVYLVCRGTCDTGKAPVSPEHCVLTGPGKATCCEGEGCPLPSAAKPPRFWQITRWFD